MGLDYSYDLVFPEEQVWKVLLSVADRQRPPGDNQQVDLILPDRTMKLPFTSSFKAEPIHVDERTRTLSLDTSLLFKVDNPIRRYIRESKYPPFRDKHARVAIGFIYLTIHINPGSLHYLKCRNDLCSFSFTAATTGMSRLFEESPFIREFFLDLLKVHQGVCGIFDDEDGYSRPVMWPPELAGHTLYEVESAVRQLVSPTERATT